MTQREGSDPGYSRLWIVAVAAVVAFIQSYEYIFPWGRGWIYDYGTGLETLPVQVALITQHVIGALLAPFVAGGVDRLTFWGNADSPLLLTTWLFAFLPSRVAPGVHMFLQCLAGSVFAGLLCRDRLKLGTPISAVAVLLYASFSYPTLGSLFGPALAPFLAWFFTVPHARSVASLLLVGGGASLLTSLSQGFPFIALFLALWLPIVARASILATVRTLGVMTIAYTLLKLPTLLAILASVAQSQRSGVLRYDSLIDTHILYTDSDFLFSDRHMWTYTQAVPAFFAVLCLPLLVIWLIEQRRPRLDSAEAAQITHVLDGLIRVGGVYVILASGLLVPLRNLLLPALPWLGSVNMVRTITESGALLNTLVVAYGLVLVQAAIRRRFVASSVAGVVLAAVGGWAMRHSWTIPAEFALLLFILAAGLLISTAWAWLPDTQRRGPLRRVPIGVVIVLPTALLAIFYTCLAPKILLAPLRDSPQSGFARYDIPAIPEIERDDRTLHRYASVLPLQPANALFLGVEPVDGWANLYPSRFRQFWLSVLAPLFENRPEERLIFGTDDRPPQDHYLFLGTGAFLPTDPEGGMDLDRRFNLNLLSLMNVRYVLSYYPLSSKYLVEVHAPPHPLKKMRWDYATGRVATMRTDTTAWPNVLGGLKSAIEGPRRSEDHVYAYRNACALPRAFSVTRLERHQSDRDVLGSLRKASPIDFMRTAYMLGTDAPWLGNTPAPAHLRLSSYRAGEIELEAVSSGEALLVIADTWMPGWKGYVDGREAPVFRVNHTQIGMPLPRAGTFHVRLAYEPAYRPLAEGLGAPTRLLAGAPRSERGSRQLGGGNLPPQCARPNAQE